MSRGLVNHSRQSLCAGLSMAFQVGALVAGIVGVKVMV